MPQGWYFWGLLVKALWGVRSNQWIFLNIPPFWDPTHKFQCNEKSPINILLFVIQKRMSVSTFTSPSGPSSIMPYSEEILNIYLFNSGYKIRHLRCWPEILDLKLKPAERSLWVSCHESWRNQEHFRPMQEFLKLTLQLHRVQGWALQMLQSSKYLPCKERAATIFFKWNASLGEN